MPPRMSAAVMTLSVGCVDTNWYCNWFLQYLKLRKLCAQKQILSMLSTVIIIIICREAETRFFIPQNVEGLIRPKHCRMCVHSPFQRLCVGANPNPSLSFYNKHNLIYTVTCELFQPRTKRQIGDRAFSVAAPRAWNRPPTELKLMRSLAATFRCHLKSFLFRIAYWLCNAPLGWL